MKKFLSIAALCGVLSMATACNVNEFSQALNQVGPAVSVILQIVALVQNKPANTALASKVSGDVADIEKLYNDGVSANAASKPGIEAQINTQFGVLNSDLATVFDLAQVKDKNTQIKISALIGLVESGVQIAEAALPTATTAAKAQAPKINPNELTDSFDKVLVAKTGNPVVDAATPNMQLHRHSKLVRMITLGRAH